MNTSSRSTPAAKKKSTTSILPLSSQFCRRSSMKRTRSEKPFDKITSEQVVNVSKAAKRKSGQDKESSAKKIPKLANTLVSARSNSQRQSLRIQTRNSNIFSSPVQVWMPKGELLWLNPNRQFTDSVGNVIGILEDVRIILKKCTSQRNSHTNLSQVLEKNTETPEQQPQVKKKRRKSQIFLQKPRKLARTEPVAKDVTLGKESNLSHEEGSTTNATVVVEDQFGTQSDDHEFEGAPMESLNLVEAEKRNAEVDELPNLEEISIELRDVVDIEDHHEELDEGSRTNATVAVEEQFTAQSDDHEFEKIPVESLNPVEAEKGNVEVDEMQNLEKISTELRDVLEVEHNHEELDDGSRTNATVAVEEQFTTQTDDQGIMKFEETSVELLNPMEAEKRNAEVDELEENLEEVSTELRDIVEVEHHHEDLDEDRSKDTTTQVLCNEVVSTGNSEDQEDKEYNAEISTNVKVIVEALLMATTTLVEDQLSDTEELTDDEEERARRRSFQKHRERVKLRMKGRNERKKEKEKLEAVLTGRTYTPLKLPPTGGDVALWYEEFTSREGKEIADSLVIYKEAIQLIGENEKMKDLLNVTETEAVLGPNLQQRRWSPNRVLKGEEGKESLKKKDFQLKPILVSNFEQRVRRVVKWKKELRKVKYVNLRFPKPIDSLDLKSELKSSEPAPLLNDLTKRRNDMQLQVACSHGAMDKSPHEDCGTFMARKLFAHVKKSPTQKPNGETLAEYLARSGRQNVSHLLRSPQIQSPPYRIKRPLAVAPLSYGARQLAAALENVRRMQEDEAKAAKKTNLLAICPSNSKPHTQ